MYLNLNNHLNKKYHFDYVSLDFLRLFYNILIL